MRNFILYTLIALACVGTVVLAVKTNDRLTPTQAWEQSSNLKAELRQLENNK